MREAALAEKAPAFLPTGLPRGEGAFARCPTDGLFVETQRHSEKLPEVAGTSQGNPGFYAVTRERSRESFFNPS